MAELRYGLGFDAHPRAADRPLSLGGVRFEGEPGLGGRSDGDVLCHALADALLGSLALGDLGEHFPEDHPAMAEIAGLELLSRTVGLVREAGFRPVACDLVVIAERPHLAGRRETIRENLARALGIPLGDVSVKATRPEGLGLAGEGAGCLALAVVSPL